MNCILIIDDDYAVRLLYQEELEDDGYEVVTFGDCENLMDNIEQHRPDVIIMDIKMGKISGLDIIQEIRSTYYDIPIILCSAYSTFKSDAKSIAADYYVVKSSDLSELKLRILMAIEGSTPND